MSEAKKTHRITLGKHSEEVTATQLADLKKVHGRRFSEYEVSELPAQPAEPSQGPVAAEKPAKKEKAE